MAVSPFNICRPGGTAGAQRGEGPRSLTLFLRQVAGPGPDTGYQIASRKGRGLNTGSRECECEWRKDGKQTGLLCSGYLGFCLPT